MKKQAIYLLILLAVAGISFAIGKQAKSPVKVENDNVVVEESDIRTQIYSDSYISGFEGEDYKVSYALTYDPSRFSLKSDAGPSRLIMTEMGKEHTVSFFNNTGAGFASTTEFWNEMKLCPTCNKVENQIDIKDAKDVLIFSTETEEWIIFAKEQFFVSVKLIKPTEQARKLIESMEVTIDRL